MFDNSQTTENVESIRYFDADVYPGLTQGLVDNDGNLLVPVDFEPDCPEVVRSRVLCVMNGEEPTLKISVDMLVRYALEIEILADKAMGVLDPGLEALIETIDGEIGDKMSRLVWLRNRLDAEAEAAKRHAQTYQTYQRQRERTSEKIKALQVRLGLNGGEAHTTKKGNTSYRVETDLGNVSVFQHHKDKIVWQGSEPKKRLGKGEWIAEVSDDAFRITALVKKEDMPLPGSMMKPVIELVPDNDAIRSHEADAELIASIPEGNRPATEPNWVVRVPTQKKG